jgi:UDP-N-acetylglucosamine--N-acetylmuramyl-(pentapeptide) pyrophosphoryl-undecaprenol N-acetylglucosamine transferase
MRVAFVGGGTGGHLTPAIGIAEELMSRGHQVEFWLSGRQVELNYIDDSISHRSLGIDDSALPRYVAALASFPRVRKYCRDFKPDLLVSLGGYGGATALAALPRPLVCLEGNVVVGKAVRLVSHFAKRVLVMFANTAVDVPRATVVGPISRSATALPSREQACAKFDLDHQRPVLLTMGGSQGALSLNQAVIEMLPELKRLNWQLLCLCGPNKQAAVHEAVEASGVDAVVLEHCSDMGAAYAAADFMLSRGGASTLAEIWLNQTPTMVMPYMHKDRQQQLNAEQLAPGVQIFDGGEESRRRLCALLANANMREQMSQSLRESLVGDGRKIACDTLEEIVGEKA